MNEPNLIGWLCSLIAGGVVLIAFFDCWGAIRSIRKDVRAMRESAEARPKAGGAAE